MKRNLFDYTLRPKALRDLEDIWFFGDEHWGEFQANTYIGNLLACLHHLSNMPTAGPRCEYIRKRYRNYGFGKHVIYYRISSQSIEVVRILGQPMLAEIHL